MPFNVAVPSTGTAADPGFVLIYSTTVGSGGVATLDTGTIDTGQYQALRIEALLRTDNNGGASTSVFCYFNADQMAANYYSLGTQAGRNQSNADFTATVVGANATLMTSQDADSESGLFSIYQATVRSPGSSSVYKHSIAHGAHFRKTATNDFRIWHEYATIWSDTSAITQIQLVPDEGGNFVEHSTFFVYGVK